MKRKLIGLMSLAVMMLFATSVFAAQQVEVKITSEPIAEHATCEKAGGYTLEFDAGTVIADGAQITIDLPLNVTLCNDIDIMIPWSSAADGSAPVNTAAAYATEDDSSSNASLTAGDAEFYLTGDAGTQRVTINVVATAGIAVGTDTGDMFTIKFFDQNLDGVFVEGNVEGTYDAAAAVADNTRCINISAYDNETVSDSLDSASDVFTFIPSNPQVAHVVSATAYSMFACAKTALDNIEIGSRTPGTQDNPDGGSNCAYFFYEDGTGYCGDTTDGPVPFIVSANADFPVTDYMVTMEIMTDGVFFVESDFAAASYASTTIACAHPETELGGDTPNTVSYYLENGGNATPMTPAEAEAGCDVSGVNRAVKVVTSAFTPVAAGARAVRVLMPKLTYDLDEIAAGDEVQVKVTLSKAPCGQIISTTFSFGVFGCYVEPQPGTSETMSFPYFTQIVGDGYWDGFSIVNKSDEDGTANLTIYEADGDVFTVSYDVAARSMVTYTTSDFLENATQIAGDGTLGDARFYMTADADFIVDGFAMLANPATGESMGYLPRLGH